MEKLIKTYAKDLIQKMNSNLVEEKDEPIKEILIEEIEEIEEEKYTIYRILSKMTKSIHGIIFEKNISISNENSNIIYELTNIYREELYKSSLKSISI